MATNEFCLNEEKFSSEQFRFSCHWLNFLVNHTCSTIGSEHWNMVHERDERMAKNTGYEPVPSILTFDLNLDGTVKISILSHLLLK